MLRAPVLLLLVLAAPVQETLQERVNRAVELGRGRLAALEQPDGAWSPGAREGETALALYTLLKCGGPREDIGVLDALAAVYAMNPATRTYDTALAILALAAHDPELHRERIADLADALIEWQDGSWGYPGGKDLSNTQYAALGLRAAAHAGVEVPVGVWRELFRDLAHYRSKNGGFTYAGGDGATGSMTAAGIGTLAICLEGLLGAKALGSKEQELGAEWTEKGLAWLGKSFSVEQNPGGGGWLYYYLYGLERMGALADVQLVGKHDWYREGAEYLLTLQREDGSWLEAGSPGVIPTCFALLFLKRATRLTFTPAGSSGTQARTGILDADAAVRVVLTGGEDASLWIDGYSKEVLARLEWPHERGRGPRIERVLYYDGSEPFATVEGDASKPAGVQRFAVQHRFEKAGRHLLHAELVVREPPPEAAKGDPGQRSLLRSANFAHEVVAESAPWWKSWVADMQQNLLPGNEHTVKASSSYAQKGPPAADCSPERACDARYGTAWLADPSDRRPQLELHFQNPVRVRSIALTSPITRPFRPGAMARLAEVEITLDGKHGFRLRMPYDERQKGRLELPTAMPVRRIEVQVLWTVPGSESALAGIGEIELGGL